MKSKVNSAATPSPSTSSSPTLTVAALMLLRREFTVAYRLRGEWLQPPAFFILVASLFAIGAGPAPGELARIAPAVIWVGALLSTLLVAERAFARDAQCGALEQLLLSPHPPSVLAFVKIAAHWFIAGAPLLLAAPLIALMLQLPTDALTRLLAALLLGTPAMSLLAALGAALTLAARQGGVLLAVLVLPWYAPILIFGVGATRGAGDAPLLWLGAILLLCIALVPLGVVAALRAAAN